MVKILALLLLASCSTYRMNIHPETANYVQKFNHYLKKTQGKEIQNLEVHFSDKLSYRTLAVCVRNLTTPTIFINTYYWKMPGYLQDPDKEEILFHEMGHCVLNRSHKDSEESIMFPYHLGRTKYQINYSRYIQELFDHHGDIPEDTVQSSLINLPKYSQEVEEPKWEKEDISEIITIDIKLIFN